MTRIPRNVIIFGPTWVGDLVMATANFAAIRRHFPDARITLLLKPGRHLVVDGSPDFDEVIVASSRTVADIWRLARRLRALRFDLALLFPNSLRSALISFLAGIPQRVGYRRDMRSFLLTDVIEYEREGTKRRPVPMPFFYGKLCEQVGVTLEDSSARLHVTEACEQAAREHIERLGIAPGEKLVGLHPGASFGSSKLWPGAHFAVTADALHREHGSRTILLVGPGEEAIANEIVRHMETPVINTSSDILPLDVLKPVIRDLQLLVTTDAGPRHYAAAFGTPVVTVMGPTDPRYSAVNLERSEVVRHDVPCGPCHLKVCPIDHQCMVGITPEEVLERVKDLDRQLGVF